MSVAGHWLLLMAVTPVLLGICCATYHWVELPPMQQTRGLTAWLRTRFARLAPGGIRN